MASTSQAENFMKELTCPICLEFFTAPVMLECGHHFCRQCTDQQWDSQEVPSCAECRQQFPARKYTVNRLLASQVERAQRATLEQNEDKRSGEFCREHGEKTRLFCKEDQSPICVRCIDSSQHLDHTFLPLQNAVKQRKETLMATLTPLKSRLKELRKQKKKQEEAIQRTKDDAKSLEEHITSEFAKLQQFLHNKEQNLLCQLWEEEAAILQEMEVHLEDIKEDTTAALETISDIQSQLEQQDSITFLMESKTFTEKFTTEQKSKAECVSHSLCPGVFKGPLHYIVWKQMKSIIDPSPASLTLDPDTANPTLILSETLTSVRQSNLMKPLPPHRKRFEPSVCVLGSEGFTSGRHYWEVEVRNKTKWDVGVASESVNRKGAITASSEKGYWVLRMRNGNEYKVLDRFSTVLSLSAKPQKIGVYLDYEEGNVSLYNADDMSHLYTFHASFTDKLYPFLSPGLSENGANAEPLKLFHLKL